MGEGQGIPEAVQDWADRVGPDGVDRLSHAMRAGDADTDAAADLEPLALEWDAVAQHRPLPDPVIAVGDGTRPLLPVGEVGLLAGAGGQGKSTLSMQIAVRAAGTPNGALAAVCDGSGPGALMVAGGPAVMVGYEDAAPWLHWRASRAAAWFDAGPPAGPWAFQSGAETGPRVPTRFVLKYTLRRRSEASGAHEAVEGGPGHAGDLGDGGLGDAQLEEAPDLVLLAVEP